MEHTASAFLALADLLPAALLLVASDGKIIAANRASARLFGTEVDRLVGAALPDQSATSHEDVQAMLRSAARVRALTPYKFSVARADRGSVDCRCEAALFRPHSEVAEALILLRLTSHEEANHRFSLLNQRIQALASEVRKRREAEASLQTLSDRLSVTLASIGDAVVTTDASGRVNFLNGVAEQLLRLHLEDVTGNHLDEIFEIFNEKTKVRVESPFANVMHSGAIVGLANHTVLRLRDGSEIPIEDSAAPIKDAEGRIVGVILVFHDVSERYALERELQRKTSDLEEAGRRKDEFLSMLAHELRNPLAPLSTGVHLIARAEETGSSSTTVAPMMKRQIGHMTRLIDDLLDVARLTRGAIELRADLIELGSVLDQAVEMSRPGFEGKGVRLELEPFAARLWMQGDPARLVQVFTNLLSNAVKYTDPGGLVSVRVEQSDGGLRVTVEDNGQGIDSGDCPYIFDLFSQGKRSLDRSQGGLGIGLTVVRTLVEMHGGFVTAMSEGISEGSTFSVWLPLGSHTGPEGGGIEMPPTARAARGRVLVVDDNLDAAEGLRDVLESWGYEATVVPSAEHALAMQREWNPAAVLLDIGLPGMSGYELAREMRAIAGEDVLLIAISGYGDAVAHERSRAAGIDHHVTKPADLDKVAALLETLPPSRD